MDIEGKVVMKDVPLQYSGKMKRIKKVLPRNIHDPKDELYLNPYSKFKKYGKIPVKLVIDFIQLLLIISFVVSKQWYQKEFLNENLGGFRAGFLVDDEFIDGFHVDLLYNSEEVKSHMMDFVFWHARLPENSVGSFIHAGPLRMKSRLYKGDIRTFIGNGSIATYNSQLHVFPETVNSVEILNETNPLGIFNVTGERLRSLFDRFIEVDLSFEIKSYQKSSLGKYPHCYHWKMDGRYDFRDRGGAVKYTLLHQYFHCNDGKYSSYSSKWSNFPVYLSVFIVLTAIISFFLHVKSLFSKYRIYLGDQMTKFSLRGYLRTTKNFVVQYLALWYPMSLLKNICLFVGCSMFFFVIPQNGTQAYNNFREFFFSFGILFSFLNFLEYFRFVPKVHFLIVILRDSFPSAVKFLIGGIPLFFGHAFAAMLWFGASSTLFQNLDLSSVTLFAAIHGDELLDFFRELFLSERSFWYRLLTRVFLYWFNSLFIVVILSIFLLVVEDAYFALAVKYKSQLISKSEEKYSKEFSNGLTESFLSPDSEVDQDEISGVKIMDEYELIRQTEPQTIESTQDHHIYIQMLTKIISNKLKVQQKNTITVNQSALIYSIKSIGVKLTPN